MNAFVVYNFQLLNDITDTLKYYNNLVPHSCHQRAIFQSPGLKVTVNVGQDEYTDLLGEEAGARVVVHPQNRIPFPEDEGFVAKPGKLTSVGLRKVKHTISVCTGICIHTRKSLMDQWLRQASQGHETCYQ